MPPTGQTRSNEVLKKLEELAHTDPGTLQCVLQVAAEYADHPSLNAHPGMPAGNRLLRQLEFGYNEMTGQTL